MFERVTNTYRITPRARRSYLGCHLAPTQTSTGRSCSDPQTGRVRQHGTNTSSGTEYTRRGGRSDASKTPRALEKPTQRHWPPLHPSQSQLRIIDRSTLAAASLPCDSSSTNDPRQYLSDCMGVQQHARGGDGAMRRDARPPPRASDGRWASALTPWLFPHEKANSQ